MALMRRWDPFADMEVFKREMDKLFDSIFGTPARRASQEGTELAQFDWTPDVDIYEDKDKIEISVDVPGMDEKDIEVKVEDDTLYIKGERKFEREDKKKDYHRIERCYGSFMRAFSLPSSVDASKSEAKLDKGVLTITLPKREEAKPKAIDIKVSKK